MKHVAFVSLFMAALPAAAWAQGADQLSAGAYGRCLAETAVRVSYTDVRNEDIFAVVKRRCAATRASVARTPQMLAVLDAADTTQAANFPQWISRLRERRHLRAVGLPIPANIGYR